MSPRRLLPLGLSILLLAACARSSTGVADVPAPAAGVAQQAQQPTEVRNLIFLIGDGMGPSQVGLLEDYAELAPNSVYAGQPTAMRRVADAGAVGLSRTHAPGMLTVDSACSATHLAAGVHAPSEVIGIGMDGNPVDTILTAAARSGRATGLVTDTRITHATPAAFAAHVAHRSQESEIAEHLIDHRVDVLLSGGAQYFFAPSSIPEDEEEARALSDGAFVVTSRRENDRCLIREAREAGYSIAFDRHAMAAHTEGPLLGLFADRSMVDAITDRQDRDNPERTYPSLREMTITSLEVLDQNPNGFFVMIEGGQIDWAAHDNDAGRLLHEMIRFDEAIDAVLEWAEGRDDTVIVITADHETGGFGFSYSGIDVPEPQEHPGVAFAERSYHPDFNFGPVDILDGLYAQSITYREILSRVQAAQASGDTDPVDLLLELVNTHTRFPITREEAERVLRTTENVRRVEGNSYLQLEEMPDICETHGFWPYYMDGHMGLIARVQAHQTHAVWNTGTHTSTPVPVLAVGPRNLIEPFDGFMHHVDIGQQLFRILGLEPVSPYDPGFDL